MSYRIPDHMQRSDGNKRMTPEEVVSFVRDIGRKELFDEIRENRDPALRFEYHGNRYPRYLKAVRVVMVELGYNEEWVDTVFRDALEDYYLRGGCDRGKISDPDKVPEKFKDYGKCMGGVCRFRLSEDGTEEQIRETEEGVKS